MAQTDVKKLKQLIKEENWEAVADFLDRLSSKELTEQDKASIFRVVLNLHLQLQNDEDREYIRILKKKIRGTRQEKIRHSKVQDQKHLETVRGFLENHAPDKYPHQYKF